MLKALLKNDMKYMRKDPMLILTLLLPFILIGVYQLIISCVPLIGAKEITSYVALYTKPLQYVLLTMGSSMPGVVVALRILDDKDEHMLNFYAISPLKLSGYFLYRGLSSFVISLIAASIASLGILGNVPIIYVLYVTVLSVLVTFGIGVLGKNKLQGMVYMKVTGIVVLLPCIRLLGENQMNWVLRCQPWDYAYGLIMEECNNILLGIGYSTLVAILYGILLTKAKNLHNA